MFKYFLYFLYLIVLILLLLFIIQRYSIDNFVGLIIPHAGKKYAGDCRKSVFDSIKNKQDYKNIIYITALHTIKSGEENKVYIIDNDNNYKFQNKNWINNNNLKEHSYDWVIDEIKENFNNAKLLVISPNKNALNVDNILLEYINDYPKNILLISTTDLIHYGKNFNNLDYLNYPQQLDKIKKEEDFIYDIINNIDINNYKNYDGWKSVSIYLKIMNYYKIKGKVVDYYDSYNSQNKDKIDRYIINHDNVNNFVSYVGIVHGIYNSNDILDFDILYSLALIKSNIIKNINKKKYNIKFPKWSPFNNIKNGIFVGTEDKDNNISCSYGNYENNNNNSFNIIKASNNCHNDAKNRWNKPYNNKNIDNLIFKLEILDLEKDWIEHTNIDEFNDNGDYGIYLILHNNRSATYLPSVFKDHEWDNNKEIFKKLSNKAGGGKLKNFKTYKTKVYKWDTLKQKLIK